MQLKYRWLGPAEWLLEKLESWPPEEILFAARELASKADPEDIQEIWQKDMDADGFFAPLAEFFDVENEEWTPISLKDVVDGDGLAACDEDLDEMTEDAGGNRIIGFYRLAEDTEKLVCVRLAE